MGYCYTVFGAGRQGVAAAYDFAKNGEAGLVRLADSDEKVAERAARRLRKLLPGAGCRFEPIRCNVEKRRHVRDALHGTQVALSAAPYRFNAQLAEDCVDSRCSFLDLGGNTDVVRAELKLHKKAKAAGVSIVPDCGLAPGLGNHLAAHGIASMDAPRHAFVRCGGLPERPVGPLGYKLVFNFRGLWNEYRGKAEFLRGGKRIRVPTLTELETFETSQFGPMEACVTSGGTSTCPQTWEGVLESFDYKTIRYPGHWAQIRTLFELGFLDEHFESRDGEEFEPVRLAERLFEARLAFPDVRDIVLLRVLVMGSHAGKPRSLQYDLFDRHDEATGFSAMERTTAFPAALVGHFQARGLIEPGARPLEVCVPPQRYLDELPLHGITVQQSEPVTAAV
jgi:lysine 6-dehydrogenase